MLHTDAKSLTLPPLKAEAAAQTPTQRLDMRNELDDYAEALAAG